LRFLTGMPLESTVLEPVPDFGRTRAGCALVLDAKLRRAMQAAIEGTFGLLVRDRNPGCAAHQSAPRW
jgi:hypothetical protein